MRSLASHRYCYPQQFYLGRYGQYDYALLADRRGGPSYLCREAATDSSISVDEIVARFTGAKRDLVLRRLETLAILG